MGCGTSRRTIRGKLDLDNVDDGILTVGGDFRLSYSRIMYTGRQVARLNEKFARMVEESSGGASERLRERQAVHVGVVVERLVQRLICNVGALDPRFSSKFLVTLQTPHSRPPGKRLRFRYLIRLDALSMPPLYPEHFRPPVKVVEGTASGLDALPSGFAKVRVHGEYLEEWAEFINPNGLLRRDKVQERFIELLARAAARPTEPSCPTAVDESRLCGSPGKILDPVALHHVLKLPPTDHVFYGAAECNESRFPDPRDFRIAIVQGTPETKLHVSFLSPTAQTLIGEGDVEVSLTLGIGAVGWPYSTDYPHRYSLDHVDVVLGYQAAQMDYYVVPKGPHSTVRCEDRTTAWEMRALATETFLEYHYSSASAIGRVFKILSILLESLRARGVKTVNRYILKNLIFYELETRKRVEEWMPRSISRRVLSILDRLLSCLRGQSLPGYIFRRRNLLLQEGVLDEDYVSDGDILEHYLRHLSHDGSWTDDAEDAKSCITIKDQLENVMLQKWTTVVSNLLPPASNRGHRLSTGGSAYTRRQMEYVALLFREILKLRHVQQKRDTGAGDAETPAGDPDESNPTEDLIYLLQIVFGQARQRAAEAAVGGRKSGRDPARRKARLAETMRSFDVSTSMLLDDLRRNRDNRWPSDDDTGLVASVIECLYKAIDSDGRVLGPVLRPYLNQLFRGSHENCWFLPEWKKKMEDLEFQAIGAFSRLVTSGDIDPMDGIVDSANKGWNWAKNCVRIMQSIRSENSASLIIGDKLDTAGSGLRIIFTPSPGNTIRCTVSLSHDDIYDDYEDESVASAATPATNPTPASTTTKKRTNRRVSAYATIRSLSSGPTHFGERSASEKQPPHAKLRDANPFTNASMEARRQGSHRGLGSIVQALISLQKLTVLQEISQYLPVDEKRKVLSDIKKLSKEVQRLTVSNYRRRSSSSTGNLSNPRKSATLPGKPEEVYRSVNEFAVDVAPDAKKMSSEDDTGERRRRISGDSLVGTCRLLRRQERQRVFGVNSSIRFGSSTMPSRNAINTPFYLRVMTMEAGRGDATGKLRRHATDVLQF